MLSNRLNAHPEWFLGFCSFVLYLKAKLRKYIKRAAIIEKNVNPNIAIKSILVVCAVSTGIFCHLIPKNLCT